MWEDSFSHFTEHMSFPESTCNLPLKMILQLGLKSNAIFVEKFVNLEGLYTSTVQPNTEMLWENIKRPEIHMCRCVNLLILGVVSVTYNSVECLECGKTYKSYSSLANHKSLYHRKRK